MNLLKSLLLTGLSALILSTAAASETAKSPVLGHSVYGSGGEKVLVLHDWMGDAANYDPVIPYLDPSTFTYVFADVRGYGRSRHLEGDYDSQEVASDIFHLAEHLGWSRFHVVGHSMNGMVVQRMALVDWTSGRNRLKSVVAITPVTADGYPADEDTRKFLWDVIGDRQLSEAAFHSLTGQRLLGAWGRTKTTRHRSTASEAALRGYYRMWLDEDFAEAVKKAAIATPIRVIGGRQDLPGFQEQHFTATLGAWFPNVDFRYITDAGHYPMHETPVYFATLVEEFLRSHP